MRRATRSSTGFKWGAACLAVAVGSCGLSVQASAYIGDSFLTVPGSQGHARNHDNSGAILISASDWVGRLSGLNSGATDPLAGDKLFFAGPNAPRPGNGGGTLVLSVSIDNPDAQILANLCASQAVTPELLYSESSQRARAVLELGPRPPQFAEWWRYSLKSAKIESCPVVPGAVERAFVIKFSDIAWLNYDPEAPRANRITIAPADMPNVTPRVPGPHNGVESWLITWFAPATTTTDAQCPQMNARPTEADVFRYLTADEQADVRRRWGARGLSFGFDSERRGPLRLNAAALPGIVADPGNFEPATTVADGINLDGNDGTRRPPRGIRAHGNFTSPDGRTGIDNQMLRVMGCVPGMRGRAGYANQTPNARRADGNVVTLIEVSGIDNDQNDPDVEVALIYSQDKPVRDTTGHTFIPGYTFRPATDPNFALYNVRVHGRIVNGVIETTPVERLQINPGQGPLQQLYQARFRIEPRPDGSAKTIIGGYSRWQELQYSSGYSEGLFNYRAESLYYALRRNADGLWNPDTHTYEGISMAYEIDTVQAYLTPLAEAQ